MPRKAKPVKRKSKKKEQQQQNLDAFEVNLENNQDRYGVKFLKTLRRFACVHPSCLDLAQYQRTPKCGHTFYACRSHKWLFQWYHSCSTQCIFCYRRLQDIVVSKLGLKQNFNLSEDLFGDQVLFQVFKQEMEELQ